MSDFLKLIYPYLGLIGVYIAMIWVLAVILTAVDKSAARRRRRRVSERALITVGFLGGAIPMLITMKAIRHKTLHKKFMIGLPLIILFHIAIIIAAIHFSL